MIDTNGASSVKYTPGWVIVLRTSPPASGEGPGAAAQKLRRNANSARRLLRLVFVRCRETRRGCRGSRRSARRRRGRARRTGRSSTGARRSCTPRRRGGTGTPGVPAVAAACRLRRHRVRHARLGFDARGRGGPVSPTAWKQIRRAATRDASAPSPITPARSIRGGLTRGVGTGWSCSWCACSRATGSTGRLCCPPEISARHRRGWDRRTTALGAPRCSSSGPVSREFPWARFRGGRGRRSLGVSLGVSLSVSAVVSLGASAGVPVGARRGSASRVWAPPSACKSLVPSGLPQPVHASHPGRAG